MKRFMLDLEALGNAPNGVVLSIGVAQFNLQGVIDAWEWRPRIDLQLEKGATVDEGPINFWLKQKELPWQPGLGRCTPIQAATGINAILRKADEIWAKPPQYDLVMLDGFFRRHGVGKTWHPKSARCLKTLFHAMANPNDIDWPERAGTHHSAADDAVHQANECIEVLNYLRGGN